jgi:hypothetical protein
VIRFSERKIKQLTRVVFFGSEGKRRANAKDDKRRAKGAKKNSSGRILGVW